MKKLFLLGLFVCMLLNFNTYAQENVTPETDVTTSDETITVDGFVFNKETKTLVSIDQNVFSGVKEITIPDYIDNVPVEKLGKYAFSHNLINSDGNRYNDFEKIILPSTLKEIGDYAFYGGIFEEITLPENVEIIGTGAFEGCENLKNIALSSNIKTIGSYAFCGCKNLSNIVIPENTDTIMDYCFENSGITEITFSGNDTNPSIHYLFGDPFHNTTLDIKVYCNKNSLAYSNLSSAFNKHIYSFIFLNDDTASDETIISSAIGTKWDFESITDTHFTSYNGLFAKGDGEILPEIYKAKENENKLFTSSLNLDKGIKNKNCLYFKIDEPCNVKALIRSASEEGAAISEVYCEELNGVLVGSRSLVSYNENDELLVDCTWSLDKPGTYYIYCPTNKIQVYSISLEDYGTYEIYQCDLDKNNSITANDAAIVMQYVLNQDNVSISDKDLSGLKQISSEISSKTAASILQDVLNGETNKHRLVYNNSTL